MGTLAVGDVILIAFPYSYFSAVKLRPALVIGVAEFNNYITCQITSQAKTSKIAIALSDSDFIAGGLKRDSFVRPDKIVTVETSIVKNVIGKLKPTKNKSILISVKKLFN